MITETEGIVLRQTKISGGRRMILIFTKQYGKISAGTSLNEKGKGKQETGRFLQVHEILLDSAQRNSRPPLVRNAANALYRQRSERIIQDSV